MSAPPFMKLYPADYDADTMHLSAAEDGVYWRLLRAMWRAGGRLPSDQNRLMRVARVAPDEWAEVAPAVLRFFIIRAGNMTHGRVQRDLRSVQQFHQHQRDAGLASAAKRASKNKGSVPDPVGTGPQPANDNPVQPKSNLSDTDKKERKPPTPFPGGRRKPRTRLPEGFPFGADIDAQRQRMIEAGCDFDVSLEAEKFRNHAVSMDRQLSSWPQAFANWIIKAIERSPKRGLFPAAAEVDPLAVWRKRLDGFARTQHWNIVDWGPKPGRDGCEVPAELLAEFPIGGKAAA